MTRVKRFEITFYTKRVNHSESPNHPNRETWTPGAPVLDANKRRAVRYAKRTVRQHNGWRKADIHYFDGHRKLLIAQVEYDYKRRLAVLREL